MPWVRRVGVWNTFFGPFIIIIFLQLSLKLSLLCPGSPWGLLGSHEHSSLFACLPSKRALGSGERLWGSGPALCEVLKWFCVPLSTTYITCPADPKKTLGIKLPFLVMIIKNLKKYFTFEVQVLDDKNVRRRFRASNYQSTTRVKPFICTMPMRLDEGWNQIQFNLSDFTRRAYGTNYIETLRVQIHANCRIRRVYFSDRLYSEDELPAEFKLYLPVQNKAK
ncbi:cilia- and flagella-associated protein 20 isoform X2 [Dryobates pubescens]|nr:cilia- and flagella-associated protein 20 isoform X2 [Dryobates pubescens]